MKSNMQESSSPLVATVAICTYNRASLLRQTLEQLRQLEIPAAIRWEVLVIDNNSNDSTPDVLREMASVLPLRSLHEARPGQSYARNMIIREARGEHILWTDDDVLVSNDWLRIILDTFNSTKADFVFGRALPWWPTPKAPRWYSPRINGIFALLDYGPDMFVASQPQTSFYGLNFAGRAAAHRTLGFFREDYGVVGVEGGGGLGEDLDMYERALAHGFKIVYQPGAVVRHHIPAERATRRYNYKKALLRQDRFYRALRQDPPDVPWLMGLPRYYYRKFIDDVLGVARGTLTGKPGDSFFFELQALRFVGLFTQAAKHGFTSPKRDGSVRQPARGSG